ncbi:hypothetical protein, partial [Sphaerotilus montanus]|uniref:hypothetical protein n=1 Tax=Sphaerotilus montanus TaxID=522889 RepID=UPI003FA2BD4A
AGAAPPPPPLRPGGGLPGTQVFGTKGGTTGIIADRLERAAVAKALRARHTASLFVLGRAAGFLALRPCTD